MAKTLKSKYNSTGERCVDACLSYGQLRYIDNDGSPIKIEVPSDKYEEALCDFIERIREGVTQNAMDPRDILKRGTITYNQAKNIATEGKIRGLDIFNIDDSIECENLLGVSGSIEYALAIWNGESKEEALQKGVIRAIKVYGDEFVKEINLDNSSDIEEYKRLCKTIHTLNKVNSIDLFKPNEFYIDDDINDDDLSTKDKLMKNMSFTLGFIGLGIGFLLAQFITNFGEFVENKVIYLSTVIITMIIFGISFMKAGKLISNKYVKDTNQSIMELFNDELSKVTNENLLTEKECKTILRNITKGEISKLLINMKGSVNKKLSCNAVITKETRFMLDARQVVVLPSEYDVKQALDKLFSIYKNKLDKDYNVKNI